MTLFNSNIEITPIHSISLQHIPRLKEFLLKYDYEKLETPPCSIKELSMYYLKYTDPIYAAFREVIDFSPLVIDNEIRATLGHLLEYDDTNSEDKNLEKAYGHFRRFNIDIFKLICNELDLFYKL